MGKAMNHLAHDPGYPGLHSHEITELSDRVGFRVWQSYIENNTPAAGRIYWAYGPGKGQVNIMGHSSLKSAIVSFICARFIPIYRRMSFA